MNNPDWPYPGARWWKFDFHTHTPASHDYGQGPDQATLQQITPRDWLLDFMQAGIDCVAVTDHNSGEWIDRLQDALQELAQDQPEGYRPLHLFPGVEVTANGGVHVLALFDVDKTSHVVSRLLGAVRYEGDPGETEVAADCSPLEVVEAVVDAGGVPILAHVDGPSGAWALRGSSLGPLLEANGLFSVEVVDQKHAPPDLYRQRKLKWAWVLGSDSHHPETSSSPRFPGSHYTWIKMAQPSLEGLRLALIDGQGFSVRRSDEDAPFDPFALPDHFIESVEVADARYMGRGEPAHLEFNPWLNAMVGGRGTGKSTVVHALRLTMRRRDELNKLDETSPARVTFNDFDRATEDRSKKGGLRKQTNIHLTLMRNGVRHRLHWRHGDDPVRQEAVDHGGDPASNSSSAGDGIRIRDEFSISVQYPRSSDDPAVEEESEDDWIPSAVQTVTPNRFPVRIFSQGQIVALSGENQQPLLQVIDEAAGVAALQTELVEAEDTFYALRARIREIGSRLRGRADLPVERQDVERKLKRFEDAGHTAVLSAYQRRSRQRREADRQLDVAINAATRIESLADQLQTEELPEGLFTADAEEDREVSAALQTIAEEVRSSANRLREESERLRTALETHRQRLSASTWQAAVDESAEKYDQLVRALRAEGVSDPDEYGRLVQERQRLDAEARTDQSEREERDRLVEQSREQLRAVQQARRALTDARVAFLSDTLAQNRFVRIHVRPYGDDPRVLEQSLRDVLGVIDSRFSKDVLVMDGDSPAGGIVAELLEDLPDGGDQRRDEAERRLQNLKSRFRDACLGNGDFGGNLNNYLKRETERTPVLRDRLMTWFPEDGLSVEYSRGGDGQDFRPIFQASAGQRSAAMLAFLLAHGEEPLVLDQPEDDLDNHLIYDLVVRQIRENKVRRQIIVVTHNPNIVVNGDAEMLHALDFVAGQCRVVQSGSLQEDAIREEVCRVMEGGREAFERRYRRLGRGPA